MVKMTNGEHTVNAYPVDVKELLKCGYTEVCKNEEPKVLAVKEPEVKEEPKKRGRKPKAK
jgi:hypothetical protein